MKNNFFIFKWKIVICFSPFLYQISHYNISLLSNTKPQLLLFLLSNTGHHMFQTKNVEISRIFFRSLFTIFLCFHKFLRKGRRRIQSISDFFNFWWKKKLSKTSVKNKLHWIRKQQQQQQQKEKMSVDKDSAVKGDLGLLEEDDEFEEFPAEG